MLTGRREWKLNKCTLYIHSICSLHDKGDMGIPQGIHITSTSIMVWYHYLVCNVNALELTPKRALYAILPGLPYTEAMHKSGLPYLRERRTRSQKKWSTYCFVCMDEWRERQAYRIWSWGHSRTPNKVQRFATTIKCDWQSMKCIAKPSN